VASTSPFAARLLMLFVCLPVTDNKFSGSSQKTKNESKNGNMVDCPTEGPKRFFVVILLSVI